VWALRMGHGEEACAVEAALGSAVDGRMAEHGRSGCGAGADAGDCGAAARCGRLRAAERAPVDAYTTNISIIYIYIDCILGALGFQ
jgi:hypothetical protein